MIQLMHHLRKFADRLKRRIYLKSTRFEELLRVQVPEKFLDSVKL